MLASSSISTDPVTSEIRELTKKLEVRSNSRGKRINQIDQRFWFSFQKKEYIIGKKTENIDNNQPKSAGEKVKRLTENVKLLEQKLAAQHLIDFADLLQQNPSVDKSNPEAVLNFAKTLKQYRNVSILDREKMQAMIKDMEKKVDVLKVKEQQMNDLVRQKNALLMKLKEEGEEIVEDLDDLAHTDFGPSAISANMALTNTLRGTIDCLKIQVRNGRIYLCSYLCNLIAILQKKMCIYSDLS